MPQAQPEKPPVTARQRQGSGTVNDRKEREKADIDKPHLNQSAAVSKSTIGGGQLATQLLHGSSVI